MSHGSRGFGQDLHQPIIRPVAGCGVMRAFADNDPVQEGDRDAMYAGIFVDQPPQFRGFIRIKWDGAGAACLCAWF